MRRPDVIGWLKLLWNEPRGLTAVRRRPRLKYGIALALCAGAGALQALLWDFFSPWAFILFLPTVLVCSFVGGFGAGIAAMGMSSVIAVLWFTGPVDAPNLVRLVSFMLNGTLLAGTTSFLFDRYLALAESRIEETLSRMGDGFVAINRELRSTFVNRRSLEMMGLTRSEVLGRRVFDLFPGTQGAEFERALRAVVGGGPPVQFEFRSGSGRWFECQFYGDNGGAKLFYREITERKRAVEMLARRNAELERSNAELEQFAHVASHDMKEPLRMISNYVRLLQLRYRGKLDEEADMYIQFAVEGTRRMQDLINDVLSYSDVGTHSSTIIDLGAGIDLALQNLRAQIQDCGARVTVRSCPRNSRVPRAVGQVMQNLVSNALKFRRPHVAPEIEIACEEEAQAWIFSVKDNGIGIAPADQERLFKLGRRIHPRTRYPGNGIGLATSKRILDRLGGRIWVRSEVHAGSTFFFSLPKESSNLPISAAL